MIDLKTLVRENIKSLKPYSSARDEFQGTAEIYLDANENAIGSPLEFLYNRYPDPHQTVLKKKIGEIKNIPSQNIFLGNGSDEVIDLLIRAFCEPNRDKILIFPPTYGMYQVSAAINNVEIVEIPLKNDFQINVKQVKKALTRDIHLIFICSPNNPSGNVINEKDIISLLEMSKGLVVIDEAYIDFSSIQSSIHLLNKNPNLVIMQTFSKAWGLASLRLGMAFADPFIIRTLSNIKPPYNVNGLTQQQVLKALENVDKKNYMVEEIINQRSFLIRELDQIEIVENVFPSEANFILVKFQDSKKVFNFLTDQGVIVRDRSKALHCENCLRITVGTNKENEKLLGLLKQVD